MYSELKKILKPGDIINYEAVKTKWYEFYLRLAYWGITSYQKKVFGKNSNYKDVHSTIYFDENHIFSVEPSKTKYIKLKDIIKKKISVYRYNKRRLYKYDVDIMKIAADKLIGSPYDYGQLLDIGFQEVLGYPPYYEKMNVFDLGKNRKVCSVGCGIVYRAFTKYNDLPKLFSKLNPDSWSEKFKKKFYSKGGYWRIEQYPPAIYANSSMFDNEFKKVFDYSKF